MHPIAYRKYMNKPKPTQPPQPKTVATSSAPKPLFAVIVGINKYAHEGVKDLNGAVSDADMFSKFLTSTLGVPPAQITNLRDETATRKAIEEAIVGLSHDKIPEDAALLIFFAGHGAEVDAPANYPSGHVKGKIQMLLPHDFAPQTKGDEVTHGQGLLDIEFARLLKDLALKKSNNITVIVDSCHSGSCTRSYLLDDPKLAVRGVELPDNFVIAVQQLMNDLMTAEEGNRAYAPAAGYETIGHGSHMLLAGCMQGEEAKENKGRGAFTTALLALFQDYGVDKLTYIDVIDKLPDLPSQHPQCEGVYKDRIIFNGQILSTQVLYDLSFNRNGDATELILAGGEAHGITPDAEFTVYADDKMEVLLGTIIVVSGSAFSTFCAPKDLKTPYPSHAFAKLTRVGKEFDVRIFIPMHNELLRPIRRVALEMESDEGGKKGFCLVDSMDNNPDLIFSLEEGRVYFETGDRVCREYGMKRMSTSLPLPIEGVTMDTISRVLLSSADFYWHLRRSNRGQILSNSRKVTVNCVKLVKGPDDNFLPDPLSDDFNIDGVIAINVDDGFQYGFKINNQSNVPLYAALFFFDVGDLSITPFYVPGRGRNNIADVSVPAGGVLTIGYGPTDTVPHTFYLREDQYVAVGYLKLFLSNKYVDFSHVEQSTPFASTRGGIRRSAKTRDLYESICITLIQKRGPVAAEIPPPPTDPVSEPEHRDLPLHEAAVPQTEKSLSQSELQASDVSNGGVTLQPKAIVPNSFSKGKSQEPTDAFSRMDGMEEIVLQKVIQSIIDMGFGRDQLMRVLRASFERLLEYLISGIPSRLDTEAAGTKRFPAGTAGTVPAPPAPSAAPVPASAYTLPLANKRGSFVAPSTNPEQGAPLWRVHVAEEDAAIERLQSLGFSREVVIESYYRCGKNAELTEDYLFDYCVPGSWRPYPPYEV
ncbi:caspase domain-containing protein [Rhodocollybia butyracea]|uniref:Caspase domain-containing protein n=1 Tax=Rhodocollybia butyracea TaxID=206335 RepID=A0A9P5P9M1_9AGAR|nr:caspase domain-containing protein [Rhodocollybia butyracea]